MMKKNINYSGIGILRLVNYYHLYLQMFFSWLKPAFFIVFPSKTHPKLMDSQDVSQEELEHRDMLMEQRTLAMACTHREPKIWMDQFSQNKWMLQLSFFDLINVQSN